MLRVQNHLIQTSLLFYPYFSTYLSEVMDKYDFIFHTINCYNYEIIVLNNISTAHVHILVIHKVNNLKTQKVLDFLVIWSVVIVLS